MKLEAELVMLNMVLLHGWTRGLLAANLVFQDTVERTYVGNSFTDIPMGIYLIRGENVVMLGEVVSHTLTPSIPLLPLTHHEPCCCAALRSTRTSTRTPPHQYGLSPQSQSAS